MTQHKPTASVHKANKYVKGVVAIIQSVTAAVIMERAFIYENYLYLLKYLLFIFGPSLHHLPMYVCFVYF